MSQQIDDEAGPSTSKETIRQQQNLRLEKEEKNCFLLLITGQIETVEVVNKKLFLKEELENKFKNFKMNIIFYK